MVEDLKSDVTLEVPLELLRRERKVYKSPIEEGNYDTVGTNGLMEADPSVLKFAGFEPGKVNTKRVLVRNTSGMPRRVYVLPATTSKFNFICDKKGNLAPGMSEEIFVQFTPEDYKYHYDCLRIQAEGCNFLVPIHAFPVMSRKGRAVPKYIDLGIREIDSDNRRQLELANEVPVDFEFEIDIIKAHKDIVIEPLRGDIKGDSKETINILFVPSAASTAVCEFEFHLSEFDYKPLMCRVSGSGMPRTLPSPPASKTIMGSTKKTLSRVQETTEKKVGGNKKVGKTLLSLKQSSRQFVIRPSSVKTRKTQNAGCGAEGTQEKMPKEAEKQERALLQGLHANVLVFEDAFVKQYHFVETQLKEREIKFFRCIGNPALTADETEEIAAERRFNGDYLRDHKTHNDVHRYALNAGNERVTVPVDIPVRPECKWNILGNDMFSLRQRHLANLVKMATTLMVRNRVATRLDKLRTRFEQENVKTKEDAEKLVHEDWKESKKIVVGEEKKGWKFEVDFTNRDLEYVRLPVEYDMGVATFKEPVEATEISSFDDLVEYTPLELLDYELHKYEPLPIPAYFNYFPIEDTKPLRPGAESEYSLRGARGDPELGNKKAEDRFLAMPHTMQVPLEYENEKLVIPNSTLRSYVPVEKYSEVDVDHYLKPRVREETPIVDEISINHRFVDNDVVFMSKYLPGNVGIRVTRRIPSRISDFHIPALAVPENYSMQMPDRRLPARMAGEDYKLDKFTESGSDNQNQFEMKVPEISKLLAEFEKGDDKMKEVRAQPVTYITEASRQFARLNSNISMERLSVSSKVPTATEQLNSKLQRPHNKLYI